MSLATGLVTANTDKNEPQKSSSANASSCNIVNNTTSVQLVDVDNNDSTETATLKSNSVTGSTTNSEDEKAKPPSGKKSKNRSRRKVT